ncbi:MAG: carboxymuconolactone decarboxylase family protein [Beijerinckiaceae bacterium]
MPRINAIDINTAGKDVQATLGAVKAKIGMVPNLFKTFAQSAAALDGYLAFSDALSKGILTGKQREIIALVVAQINGCHYCLSAHSLLGKNAGLSADGIRKARAGRGENATDDAIAVFAGHVVETRGRVSDSALAAARKAGLSDAQIVETIANVAHNVLTNYTNNAALTDIDFPVVDPNLSAAA